MPDPTPTPQTDPIVPSVETTDPVVVPAPKVPAQAKKTVAFNAEQMEIIQAMIQEARGENTNRRPDAISMYNMRDPKAIETVNVKRLYGKYVMGFKNMQMDPMKKTPKWLTYKADPTRGFFKEPYVTLFLQTDEKSPIEEKEVLLLDYTQDREFYKAKVVNIDLTPVLKENGYLGSNAEYAGEVDDKGIPVQRLKVLAEVMSEERVFSVTLEGFSTPQKFISDFLA